MNSISRLPEHFKPKPKPPAEPPRRRVPHIEAWSEYRAASARAANEPGPAGEVDRQAALTFAREQMPPDIATIYFSDVRR